MKIIGSGGLDEYDLAELSAGQIPYDSYGIGTKMGISADAPWSDMSYKLVEYDNRPVLKLSTGKVSCPGKKQIFRLLNDSGKFARDLIARRDENLPGERLLKEYLRDGVLVESLPSLLDCRAAFARDFAALPDAVRAIREPKEYAVEFSAPLRELQGRTAQQFKSS
jgi:nicotinate phosphoribosyltransferase